ncbi:MAG: hypothetical protein JSW26_24965 [Desulfobacterales bacterium]|nr:MAG: hypothetical protein JSW26_24965 [Desulfobacterales bacterium]
MLFVALSYYRRRPKTYLKCAQIPPTHQAVMGATADIGDKRGVMFKVIRMIRPTIIVALVMGLILGCSSLQIRDRMQEFEDANRAYRQAVSWSEYVVAATFLKSGDQDQEKLAADIEYLNNFRVTAYEPRLLTVVEKDVRIRQVVKISYFRKDDLVVKSASDDQLWEYDPEKRTWLLTTGFPKLN